MKTSIIPITQKPLDPVIGIDAIYATQERLDAVLTKVRESMLAPTAKKRSPLFSAQQLAQIIGLEKSRISYRAVKDKLPPGVLNANGSKREWTLTEVREWARSCRPEKLRQKGKAAAATICIANFKGGVAKTTTAATLAQGLSLRGHKVLIVDTDPQGSLSVLAGVDPTSVEMDETVLPLYQGSETSLQYAVRPSYWAGVDIVASSPIVYDAEFALPARQANDPHFEFWSVLDLGLDPLRDEYDVIIIDTPPSLSYSTINALMASDGLVMPIPPNMLDFASSAQFWRMYLEFAEPIKRLKGVEKLFNFINVLMTRVDNQEAMSSDVRRWIMSAYGDSVLPIEIPKTSTASTASAEFGTAYDLSDAMANSRTWKRAHDAYERFVDLMEEQVIGIWANQTQDSSGAPNAAITKI